MVGAILGGVSVLGGLYSAYQQDQAQQRGEQFQAQQMQLAQRQQNLTEQQLQQQQYEYNRYQELYGGLEENLANYYQNLSADTFSGTMYNNIQQSFNQASTQLREDLASRGIVGSGVEAQAMTDLAGQKAIMDAQVQQQAEQQVVNAQQGFFQGVANPQLQTQQQRVDNAFAGNINAFGNISNAYGQQATNQFGLANQYGQSAGQALQGGFKALGNAFEGTGNIDKDSQQNASGTAQTTPATVLSGKPIPASPFSYDA